MIKAMRNLQSWYKLCTPCLWCLVVLIFTTNLLESAQASRITNFDRCAYRYEVIQVPVEERYVQVEHYIPTSKALGVLFMIHGSAGAYSVRSLTEEPLEDNFGEKNLAAACFSVYLPHYFEALDVSSMTSIPEIETRSAVLLETLNKLIDFIKATDVSHSPIFLFGESLGAYLGLEIGLTRPDVAAVSEISGGLRTSAWHPRRNFSVLISHGLLDQIVPVQNAETIASFCRRNGIAFKEDLYQSSDHYFNVEDRNKCIGRTAAFFKNAYGADRKRLRRKH